jgi:hypothetical protein
VLSPIVALSDDRADRIESAGPRTGNDFLRTTDTILRNRCDRPGDCIVQDFVNEMSRVFRVASRGNHAADVLPVFVQDGSLQRGERSCFPFCCCLHCLFSCDLNRRSFDSESCHRLAGRVLGGPVVVDGNGTTGNNVAEGRNAALILAILTVSGKNNRRAELRDWSVESATYVCGWCFGYARACVVTGCCVEWLVVRC